MRNGSAQPAGSTLHRVPALALLSCWILACTPSSLVPTPAEGEWVTVSSVIDGDTVELTDGRLVRYLGINTPEHDQPFYQEARNTNRQLVEGKDIRLVLDIQPIDQFGRTLAYLWAGDRFVNRELLQRGYANVYTEPPNVRYAQELLTAEQEARDAGIGLWMPANLPISIREVNYDAPGPDHQNPNGEWVEIVNEGPQVVDLTGFTLKDEANHIYTFSVVQIEPGKALRLLSGAGRDSEGMLYWGLDNDAVWSNDGDTAYLRDRAGRLVDYYTY